MGSNYQYCREAARRVEDGWVSKKFWDKDGNVCLIQSLSSVSGLRKGGSLPPEITAELVNQLRREPDYEQVRLLKFLSLALPYVRFMGKRPRLMWWRPFAIRKPVRLAIRWNDKPGRTKQEVVDLLDRVADSLESKAQEAEAEVSDRQTLEQLDKAAESTIVGT